MQQQQQTKNIVIFVVSMALCFAAWYGLKYWMFPPPPPPPPPAPAEARLAAALLSQSDGGLAQGLTQAAVVWNAETKPASESKPEEKPIEAPPPPVVAEKPPPTSDKWKTLGSESRTSKFHMQVVLTPRGGGVLSVVLNKFQQADALGRPVTASDGSPQPLKLVPEDDANPSNQLLHFDVNKKDDDKPYDTLGKADWTGSPDPDGKTDPDIVTDTVDGRERQSVTFWSPQVQGFQVAKTYSLTEGEYHLGLEVKVKRLPAADPDKTRAFRYQMTGFHGLPVEGRWYTNIFRNAVTAQVDSKTGYVSRDLQDLRQTMSWEGGNAVDRQQGYVMRYAGVAVQYFASVIVVDNKQEKQDFLAHVRPTLETTVAKGVISNVDLLHNSFELVRSDNNKPEKFRIREDEKEDLIKQGLHKDMKTAVVYTTGGYDGDYPEYAHKLLDDAQTQPLWEDDVTVRVATEPIELKPGGEVVHKYLLYNGPVKTMLLSQMGGVEAVRPELVNRYLYDLNLDTLTDYQSNNWFGNYITGPLRISYLLIQITNIMHTVLWGLHYYAGIPYIVCIMILTLMVRGVMFPVSRKQAMTSLRMQELAPELKKLKEKFPDDKQAMGTAQMELYRKHGIHPLGTCWMLMLQMPIFMGLYYSLQESIHFRLAGVSSYWMPNLAAPDMLVYWSNNVPFISQPEYYGWIFYLGPFLNILPILAVSLMIVQQKWTMPPPTDEQQEQQQKMMKYMMVFMGVMFYKVASGLCIYFIASSVWGFVERRMLPKRKPGAPPAEAGPGLLARLLPPKSPNGTAVATGPAGAVGKETFSSRFFQEEPHTKGKRGKRRQDKVAKAEDDGSMWQRLRAWWEDVLEQAQKK
jgi:YidC/Oxa1 family membrane protein insertase